jgi:hypothetical protein
MARLSGLPNKPYSQNEGRYDSIDSYNKKLGNLLLKCGTLPETLSHPYRSLTQGELHMYITTSPDGLFRIYSWDSQTGGTMRGVINVFQFQDAGQSFSETAFWDHEDDEFENNYFYDVLDSVSSNGKIYYVVKCLFIGSSTLTGNKIKIFSIDGGKLNDKAKLIKTKTGIHNELQYDIDFSDSVNQHLKLDYEVSWLQYDKKTKTISIPLITEEGKLTARKIRYRFNGTYFVKI